MRVLGQRFKVTDAIVAGAGLKSIREGECRQGRVTASAATVRLYVYCSRTSFDSCEIVKAISALVTAIRVASRSDWLV